MAGDAVPIAAVATAAAIRVATRMNIARHDRTERRNRRATTCRCPVRKRLAYSLPVPGASPTAAPVPAPPDVEVEENQLTAAFGQALGAQTVQWGAHTPKMSAAELKNYLETDLANELHWVLRAATEWHAHKHMNLGIDGYSVQVYAMDSTFLHSRALFEFFTRKTQGNFYGYDAYGLTSEIRSSLYDRHWIGPLHARLMHAQERSKTADVKSFDPAEPKKHIKNMPVDFAMEIVRMWHEFASALQSSADENMKDLGVRAGEILDKAKGAAEKVRTNEVTQSQVAELKKTGKLPTDFSIPPLSWPD